MPDAYLDEIAEQPAAIRNLRRFLSPDITKEMTKISQLIREGRINHIILTGMGGSFYSAYGTWLRLSNKLHVPVSLWDTSELIQQAPLLLREGTMVIAISQSGESAELRRLATMDKVSSLRVSITNTRHNTLTSWAHFSLATQVGDEKTVSTKTYIAGLAALYILETYLLGQEQNLAQEIDNLAIAIETSLPKWQEKTQKLTRFFACEKPILFIGRGASYASAEMGALMMAEAAKAFTCALTGGQFRHGPLELVREGFQSILFMGQGNELALNQKTTADILRLDGRCLLIASESSLPELPLIEASAPNLEILRIPNMVEALLPILEIIPLQLFMVPFATARNFKPATFLNGEKITTIE